MVAAILVAAALARYLLIQAPDVAHACEAGAESFACMLRLLVIRAFSTNGLGITAIAATVLTLLTWNRGVAWIAALVGAAGLVLYSYEPAAVSFVTGALVLARAQSGRLRPAFRDQHAETERQT